ncbi:MAG: glycosyltransferase [Flavobacteriia bacterium]|nr:glycosyltransferase [Flavobacteriia bacterium]
MKEPIICLLLPCYNEEAIINYSVQEMLKLITRLIEEHLISDQSFLCLVDDGSKDNTWFYIDLFTKESKYVRGIKLSRNYGHQSALLAGITQNVNKCDAVITIDADLQDDIEVIPEMISLYLKGIEIVYGVRDKRDTDSWFKRNTAKVFYKLMIKLGVNIIENHADYRLMSKNAINNLLSFKESNLFLRGMIPLIGLKSENVYYNRKERLAGETKYPLRKMISFAIDGITSFSTKPLRMISVLGLILFLITVCLNIYALYSFLTSDVLKGWTSIVLPLYFLSGFQLLAIGIIAEYVGKIYKETKKRPSFFIEEELKNK